MSERTVSQKVKHFFRPAKSAPRGKAAAAVATAQTAGHSGNGAAPGSQPAPAQPVPAQGSSFGPPRDEANLVDLQRRRDQLNARVAELQWDLGGLVYEMAIRDRIRVDVLVRRAAELQNADAELGEVERILRLEQDSTAGQCASCGAPHSSGAAYCWQCGQPLLKQVHTDAIAGA
jgi:chorismate mutase